jgi:hypothetical protein
MNKYSHKNKEPNVTNFCCINHFVEEIIDELFNSDEEFASTSIVANKEFSQDLIRVLLSLKDEDDDFVFDMAMVSFDSVEYDSEYIISIGTDFEVWCEPMWRENEYSTGYLNTESEHAYVLDDSNFKVLDNIDCDDITIFGFEDNEDEIDDDSDEDDCDGDCESCECESHCETETDDEEFEIESDDELSDDVSERIRIIVECADKIVDMSCPHCVCEELIQLAKTFEKIGHDQAKDEMQCMLDCMDDEDCED